MFNYITSIKKIQGDIPKKTKIKYSKYVKQNNVIDLTRLTWKPKAHIKKISKHKFILLETKEEREFMPKVEGNQMRNRRSLRKIFVDLRQLITTNFEGEDCEKFCTLTYREQTNDPAKIQKDLNCYNLRLKRAYPGIGFIHIVEPHASGNWHVHSLIKNVNGEPLNATYEDIYRIWGHGYVTVEELHNVDHIGAYFIAYFSNMEIADEDLHKYKDDIKEMPRADGNGTKKVIKGKRLDFYPDYMKIYRGSKNLKKPEQINGVNPADYNMTYNATFQMSKTDTNTGEYTDDTYINKKQYKKRGTNK